MQLAFDFWEQLTVGGTCPAAFHTGGKRLQVWHVGTDGQLHARVAETPNGLAPDLVFRDLGAVTLAESSSSKLKMKYQKRYGLLASWLSTEGVRWAMYYPGGDAWEYLDSGSVRFTRDDPVASLELQFSNPDNLLSGAYSSLLAPGNKITLNFFAGSAGPVPVGVFYVDRVDYSTAGSVSVSGRNGIGRLLKEQTLNEAYSYPLRFLWQQCVALLTGAGVPDYWTGGSEYGVGLEFSPDTTYYDAIQEFLKTVRDWKLGENLDGSIGIGWTTDEKFHQPADYYFSYQSDVWAAPGRRVVRDDQEAYARIRVHTPERTSPDFVEAYATVVTPTGWVVPSKKTLHVEVADKTTLADAQALADELATRLASVGTIQTFIGPIRPWIQPGDTAKISDSGLFDIGVITEVRHSFGKAGFSTEFTVDSGGALTQGQISDMVAKISKKAKQGVQAKRLY